MPVYPFKSTHNCSLKRRQFQELVINIRIQHVDTVIKQITPNLLVRSILTIDLLN